MYVPGYKLLAIEIVSENYCPSPTFREHILSIDVRDIFLIYLIPSARLPHRTRERPSERIRKRTGRRINRFFFFFWKTICAHWFIDYSLISAAAFCAKHTTSRRRKMFTENFESIRKVYRRLCRDRTCNSNCYHVEIHRFKSHTSAVAKGATLGARTLPPDIFFVVFAVVALCVLWKNNF